jgi:ATP-dependent protease ClpP protease subunit
VLAGEWRATEAARTEVRRTIVVRRMADTQIYLAGPVGPLTIPPLMQAVTERVSKGARSLLLAISSPGGQIYWGVTAYNFLRGLGIEVITHNFGQVDSISGVIFCAGDRRLSVTQARFLIHGVSSTFPGTNVTLPERALSSVLTSLARDRDTIASILASRTGTPLETVKQNMLDEVILTAAEAIPYGFVHEIKDEIFDPAQEIVQIISAN